MAKGPGEVSVLLRAWHGGDDDAYREVSSILYSELRRQAAHVVRRRRPGTIPIRARPQDVLH